ncbi:hypothetical protein M885DRAFT_610977 [Pelagophyceae sp. CCMP2097]|nr:hypothetical protein M885DRAFT_610977 [Pelagophyceae sp. CCMP2097]
MASPEAAISGLLAKLEAIESEVLQTNKALKKCAVAVQLVTAHEQLQMHRGVVKFADVALSCDAACVAAHVAKAKALAAMLSAAPTAAKVAKARGAARAGLEACARVVSLEGLGAARRTLEEVDAHLAALETVPGKPRAPKPPAAQPEPAPAPRRLAAASDAPLAAPSRPATEAPTTARVRACEGGGAPMVKSVWNTKDTWEERDLTNWAADRLGELLEAIGPLDAGEGCEIAVTAATRLAGHAQIVLFQQRARFVFDFESLELAWRCERAADASAPESDAGRGAADECRGTFVVRDVANSLTMESIELEGLAAFAPETDAGRTAKVFLHAQRLPQSVLRKAIVAAALTFEQEMCDLTDEGCKIARTFERSKRLAAAAGDK